MEQKNLKKKFLSPDSITLFLVVIAYAVISGLVYTNNAGSQLKNVLISLSCYIVMALSLNLVVGLLGELSLGHAGFLAVGAFSGCMVSIALSDLIPTLIIRLPLSMIIGGLCAALIGFAVGLPALRLKGDYLAIVTLGCGEIIKNVITNLNIPGTTLQGALGLSNGKIYSSAKTLLPYAIVLVLLTLIVMMNFKRSKHGRAIMAIRDNRIAAESSGINITYYKLLVFVLSAFFAGMAGTLYGHSFALIKASTFDLNMSIEFLVIVVLGGMGSLGGSILATVILRALQEVLREFSSYRMLAYSILLIVIMILNENEKFRAWKSRLTFANFVALIKKIGKKKSPAQAAEKEE